MKFIILKAVFWKIYFSFYFREEKKFPNVSNFIVFIDLLLSLHAS